MKKRITIDQLRSIARGKNGECLSSSYKGIFVKHKWKCQQGHVWEATPDSVKHGSWCPKCSLKFNGVKKRKYSIEDMRELARNRNGECLSKVCSTTQVKLKWKCQQGHTWEAIPASVIRGSWCRLCGIAESAKKRSNTIEDMLKVAKERNGNCLSNEYIHNNKKLLWECEKGHQWRASGSSVLSGTWCPKCAYLNSSLKQRGNIEQMHTLARNRGGRCLSKEYINSHTKLEWECQDGHTWSATPGNIQSNFWCPQCCNLIGENLTREYLEKIFEKKFPKIKPTWLLSKRNTRMELDGFCEELSLAFEHQGRHHYKKTIFTKNDSDLSRRKDDDQDKILLCKKHNVTLIIVPEVGYLTKIEKLYDFLIAALTKMKIQIPVHEKPIFHLLNETVKNSSQLRLLELLAQKKKGILLSTVYLGNHRKHKWKCENGHIWDASPSKIKQGRWCHECNSKKKFTIEYVKNLAEKFKGKCLSEVYINGKSKIRWECEKGHQWEAGAVTIKQGHWCPKCAQERNSNKQRGTIEKMHLLAKERGGKCLSKVYVNARSKLKWECHNGHVWETTPDSIQVGRWCPKCAYINNAANFTKNRK